METLEDKKKVNLFLIGAPKCGTTSYARALASSSGVFIPPEKELNFFSNKWLNVTNSYYDGVKIDSLKKYAAIFAKCDEFSYRCDASVSYFIADGCPEEIFNYNKKAKVVFISRDPIERAVSHYLMDNRLGYSSRGLSEYLNDTSSHQYLQYIENSRYSKYLSSYRWYFGENLLELTLEDGWDINKERLEKFLGIELKGDFERKNTGLEYRNKFFSRLSRKRRYTEAIKKVVKNERIRNVFRMILVSSKASNTRVDKKEKELLEMILRDET